MLWIFLTFQKLELNTLKLEVASFQVESSELNGTKDYKTKNSCFASTQKQNLHLKPINLT